MTRGIRPNLLSEQQNVDGNTKIKNNKKLGETELQFPQKIPHNYWSLSEAAHWGDEPYQSRVQGFQGAEYPTDLERAYNLPIFSSLNQSGTWLRL